MFDTANKHPHSHAQNRFAAIPTTERLVTDRRCTGRGVRIAFLDSGFIAHPDFASRVVEFHDIAGEEGSLGNILTPSGHHWHGTQTVASCAGDGTLSDGIYRGLAFEAELVLVKVTRAGRIGDAEIEGGMRWLIANHRRLEIKILNISLGGDCDVPTEASAVNALIEELIAAGVVVTVAAGNSVDARSAPPASAPSAITVGGFSDKNQFDIDGFSLYHSNNGVTADGLVKPELVAPAMYVAAPILPGTPEYDAAEALSMLATTPDYAFRAVLEESWNAAGLDQEILDADADSARKQVESALNSRKIVATHYQHVDGTSFAAPITASVVALLLEANPSLTPVAVKNILISTARRLGGNPAMRQGFGVLNAKGALELAKTETHALTDVDFHPPKIVGSKIIFRFHNDAARSVSLASDMSGWRPLAMENAADGLWYIGLDCRPPGKYLYKFLIDGERWIEDPSHGLKEDDGLGGFNSVLLIG